MTVRYCEVCSAEISEQRLEGIPDTHLCTEHAEQIKQFGGEFVMTAEQERTSKEGSLKLNYGAVETTRRRDSDAIRQLRDQYRLDNPPQ